VLVVVAVLVTLVAACGVDALWIEPHWVEVSQHTFGEGPRTIRVLHLTDLHIDHPLPLLDREQLCLDLARDRAPDLIVVTGDTVSSGRDKFHPEAATAFLKQLVATAPPLGVWACVGNHEDWVGPESLTCYREAGVPLLAQTSQPLLGGALVLHGVSSHEHPIPPSTPGLDVILCHYPAVLPAASARGHELVLAGHAHGGQIVLPLWGPPWLPYGSGDSPGGWYEQAGARMFVSRGVGMSVLPLRFLCRPEIAIIELRLPTAP
jgi:uncharacterized protein